MRLTPTTACVAAAFSLATPLLAEVPTLLVDAFPYPQLNTGSGGGLAAIGDELAFLTQQPGTEDIYFLDLCDGSVLRQVTPRNSGTGLALAIVTGLGSDGTWLYAANNDTAGDSVFFRLDPASGSGPQIFTTTRRYDGITSMNGLLYISVGSQIEERTAAGTLLRTLAIAGAGLLRGLGDDGTNLFACDAATGMLYEISVVDGSVLDSAPGPWPPGFPSLDSLEHHRGRLYLGEVNTQVIYVFGPCGDYDCDGDIDLSDFTIFQLCFGGATNPPAPTCPPGVEADCDGDFDVDLADFLIFQQNFTGSE